MEKPWYVPACSTRISPGWALDIALFRSSLSLISILFPPDTGIEGTNRVVDVSKHEVPPPSESLIVARIS